MALRRRTRVLGTVGWLVCQVIEMPNIDDVDQAALDTHISRHSPSATRGTRVRARAGTLTPRRGLNLRLACGSPPRPITRRTPPAQDLPAPRAALGGLLALTEPVPVGVAHWSDRIKFWRASPTARAGSDRA
jgi:hypothetical protein